MLSEDLRFKSLSTWVRKSLALEVKEIVPASSDASFRRYFRIVTEQQTLIVMDALPERENMRAFLRVARLLNNAQVRVPQVFDYDLPRGFMLLEDFGSTCYLDQLRTEDPETLYAQACDSLWQLQCNTVASDSALPHYDEALLLRELTIFYEWFLAGWLQLALPADLQQELNTLLIDSALAQPKVVVHRDFHSRNLMVLPHASPGVIDFQDAVIGPITYDLVSLCKDCYINWPPERVDAWRDRYWQRLSAAGLVTVDAAQFKQWFDWMGLQRHLKAIGIFARLHLRDGKSGYLADIPRTLDYVLAVCAAYPELQRMHAFLVHELLPCYQRQ